MTSFSPGSTGSPNSDQKDTDGDGQGGICETAASNLQPESTGGSSDDNCNEERDNYDDGISKGQ